MLLIVTNAYDDNNEVALDDETGGDGYSNEVVNDVEVDAAVDAGTDGVGIDDI